MYISCIKIERVDNKNSKSKIMLEYIPEHCFQSLTQFVKKIAEVAGVATLNKTNNKYLWKLVGRARTKTEIRTFLYKKRHYTKKLAVLIKIKLRSANEYSTDLRL